VLRCTSHRSLPSASESRVLTVDPESCQPLLWPDPTPPAMPGDDTPETVSLAPSSPARAWGERRLRGCAWAKRTPTIRPRRFGVQPAARGDKRPRISMMDRWRQGGGSSRLGWIARRPLCRCRGCLGPAHDVVPIGRRGLRGWRQLRHPREHERRSTPLPGARLANRDKRARDAADRPVRSKLWSASGLFGRFMPTASSCRCPSWVPHGSVVNPRGEVGIRSRAEPSPPCSRMAVSARRCPGAGSPRPGARSQPPAQPRGRTRPGRQDGDHRDSCV
jgi:hypothetical protein